MIKINTDNPLQKTNVIVSIQNAKPMTMTTLRTHKLITGSIVSFSIPSEYGMKQLNGVYAQILVARENYLMINLDSSSFEPFSYPKNSIKQHQLPVVISSNIPSEKN
jgi:translation elongation factor P/translation initiation factor 5A